MNNGGQFRCASGSKFYTISMLHLSRYDECHSKYTQEYIAFSLVFHFCLTFLGFCSVLCEGVTKEDSMDSFLLKREIVELYLALA